MGLNTARHVSCPQARVWLFAWADGRLPAAERAAVDRHLRGCGACQRQAQALADVHDVLAALPVALRPWATRASRGWPSVWARVAGAATRRPPVRRLSVLSSLAVAALVVAAYLPGSLGAPGAQAAASLAVAPQGATAQALTPRVYIPAPLAPSPAVTLAAARGGTVVRAEPAPTPAPRP